MIDRIKEYIFKLFESAPQTSRVNEAKEELLAGCIDKYNDLVNSGKTDVEAYSEVIAGIGDVNELLATITEVKNAPNNQKTYSEKPYTASQKDIEVEKFYLKNKRSKLISSGIFLFIFGLTFLIVLSLFDLENFGAAIMFILWSVGVFIIFYGITSTKSKYGDDVKSNENYYDNRDFYTPKKGLKGPIVSTMWCLTVILYLLISFVTYHWEITWLIFILASVVQMLINYFFSPPNHRKGHMISIIWTSCVFIYLFISMVTYRWDITWILFPITVGVQQVIILYYAWRRSK